MLLKYQIELLKNVSEKKLKEINHLLFQLDPTYDFVDSKLVKKIVSFPGSFIFVAKSSEGNIIGMITLVSYPMFYGSGKAWIEDVVVDQSCRGQGIGKALIKKALDKAKEEKIKSINLTSRPSRKRANSLYTEIGFVCRNTNCYRFAVK